MTTKIEVSYEPPSLVIIVKVKFSISIVANLSLLADELQTAKKTRTTNLLQPPFKA